MRALCSRSSRSFSASASASSACSRRRTAAMVSPLSSAKAVSLRLQPKSSSSITCFSLLLWHAMVSGSVGCVVRRWGVHRGRHVLADPWCVETGTLPSCCTYLALPDLVRELHLHVYVGPELEQHLDHHEPDLVVALLQRHGQRRAAVRVGGVDVELLRAFRELLKLVLEVVRRQRQQRLHALDVRVLDGEHLRHARGDNENRG